MVRGRGRDWWILLCPFAIEVIITAESNEVVVPLCAAGGEEEHGGCRKLRVGGAIVLIP